MLPRILKNMNLFIDGTSYAGEVEATTLPKLTRKIENFRAGGMAGAAPIDLGLDDEAMAAEATIGGAAYQLVKKLGIPAISGTMLRFAGAVQRDHDGVVEAMEVVMRGRVKEVDLGELKVGEKNATKLAIQCTYYKLSVNGTVQLEVDILNMVYKVDGKDLLEEHRKAIGL